MSLKHFEKNISSQFGEDGVIEEIFKRIGIQNKLCVEFGAWDGLHLSNAWNLWNNYKWEALLIEGDSNKFNTLKENTKSHSNVSALNAFVTTDGENSLDEIFNRLSLRSDIDLLSIDIDGDDYYIFESLKKYRPRLILVEYNPSIPPDLDIVQTKGEYFGCSALALYNLGHLKDYKLIHMTDTNMFFVRSEDFDKLKIDEQELKQLFPKKYLTNVITSYNGSAFLTRVPVYMDPLKKENRKSTKLPLKAADLPHLIPVTILGKNIEK